MIKKKENTPTSCYFCDSKSSDIPRRMFVSHNKDSRWGICSECIISCNMVLIDALVDRENKRDK